LIEVDKQKKELTMMTRLEI